MILLVYVLVQHYTITYYGIGIVFGVAMFCFCSMFIMSGSYMLLHLLFFSDVSHSEWHLWALFSNVIDLL